MHCFHMLQGPGVIPFKLNYMWGPLPLPLEESERHTGGKYYQRVVVGVFRDKEKVVLKEYRDDVAEPWSERYQGSTELTKSKLV